jgi:serine/threonine protein kinase
MGSRPKHSDDEQYEPILRALGASVARREPWLHVGVSGRRHGWKLHVTTVPTQAERLLRIVVPHLLDGDHSFKIAADSGVLRRLNEGALGDTQVGKFCTIYPATDACATELIATLNSALATDFVGPRVNTDARIGPVLYTRYGSFQPNVRRDRLGLTYATITLPDGSTIRDAYSVPFAAPPGIDVPFQPTDDRLNHIAGGHLFADRLLLIDILKSGAKGRIFLAIDMSEQDNVRQVVLKEGRQYCLSDQHGRDMRDRLKHQHYVLSKIAALGIAPLPGHYFQSDGDGYLTVNYTPGHDYASLVSVPYRHLGKTERGQLLTCLSDLSCAVATLHAAGIIHRDVTPSNTRWSYDGGATLLDFELSFVLGAAQPVYHLGTPGYMSPQQQFASASPTPADDVYAFGCLASLLITSFDPRYVVGAPRTRRGIKLKQLSGAPSPLIDLLDRAMDRDPARRPEMRHICETLAHLRESDSRLDIYPDRPVLKRSRTSWPPKRILEKVAGGLLRAVVRDDKGLWLSNISPNDHQSISGQRLDYCRSAYRGVAGPVYLLARYTQANGAIPGASDTAAAAIDWLLAHVQTPDDQMPGLHFGEAGVAVAISEAVAAGLVNGGTWLREYLQEALQGPLEQVRVWRP